MTIKFQYCVYCQIDDNLPVFIGDDYRDNVCSRHKDKPLFRHDARDLENADRVDYREPNQMSINEEIEQERREETLEAMQSSRRQFK